MDYDVAMFKEGEKLLEDGIDRNTSALALPPTVDHPCVVSENLAGKKLHAVSLCCTDELHEEKTEGGEKQTLKCPTVGWTRRRVCIRSSNPTASSQPMSRPSMGDCQPGRTRHARQCPAITTATPTPELASEKARASKSGIGRGMRRERGPRRSRLLHQSRSAASRLGGARGT